MTKKLREVRTVTKKKVNAYNLADCKTALAKMEASGQTGSYHYKQVKEKEFVTVK